MATETVQYTDPVDVLGFSPRVWNALDRQCIHTIGDLVACDGIRLLDIRSFGPTMLHEVTATLAAHGLELKPSSVPLPAPPHPTPASMIREFHAAMGDYPHQLGFPTPDVQKLRQALLDEEVQELRDATDASDIVAVADALADIVYVAYGTAYAHGIDLDAVLRDVHRSNMTKDFTGPAGDRKAKKGANYQRPDIARVVGLTSSK